MGGTIKWGLHPQSDTFTYLCSLNVIEKISKGRGPKYKEKVERNTT
jgi:hypothetical protein